MSHAFHPHHAHTHHHDGVLPDTFQDAVWDDIGDVHDISPSTSSTSAIFSSQATNHHAAQPPGHNHHNNNNNHGFSSLDEKNNASSVFVKEENNSNIHNEGDDFARDEGGENDLVIVPYQHTTSTKQRYHIQMVHCSFLFYLNRQCKVATKMSSRSDSTTTIQKTRAVKRRRLNKRRPRVIRGAAMAYNFLTDDDEDEDESNDSDEKSEETNSGQYSVKNRSVSRHTGSSNLDQTIASHVNQTIAGRSINSNNRAPTVVGNNNNNNNNNSIWYVQSRKSRILAGESIHQLSTTQNGINNYDTNFDSQSSLGSTLSSLSSIASSISRASLGVASSHHTLWTTEEHNKFLHGLVCANAIPFMLLLLSSTPYLHRYRFCV
jgi:hypothetical protein